MLELYGSCALHFQIEGHDKHQVHERIKPVGDIPVFCKKIIFGPLAGEDENKEGASQINQKTDHHPKLVFAVNKQCGSIVHLLIQVIKRIDEDQDGLDSDRYRINIPEVRIDIIDARKYNKQNTQP